MTATLLTTGALGATLVVARLWHAQGLFSSSGTSAGRFMGTNLTGLVILAGALAALARGAQLW
jgi:uncharacterized membrane protein YecN with MAPEG domain